MTETSGFLCLTATISSSIRIAKESVDYIARVEIIFGRGECIDTLFLKKTTFFFSLLMAVLHIIM